MTISRQQTREIHPDVMKALESNTMAENLQIPVGQIVKRNTDIISARISLTNSEVDKVIQETNKRRMSLQVKMNFFKNFIPNMKKQIDVITSSDEDCISSSNMTTSKDLQPIIKKQLVIKRAKPLSQFQIKMLSKDKYKRLSVLNRARNKSPIDLNLSTQERALSRKQSMFEKELMLSE